MTSSSHVMELIRYVDLTPVVRSFEFRVVNADFFAFLAGQFITIEFTLEGKTYNRSYSLASPPRGDETVEVCAKYNKGGPGTQFLWSLQPGAQSQVAGPFGDFYLRRPEPRHSLFIATGTGIAPIRSMIHTALREEDGPGLTLLFGVPTQLDLLYHSEFVELSRRSPKFSYRVTLSQPEVGWSGLHGWVQHHIASVLNNREDVVAYISGSQVMVQDVSRLLEQMGLNQDAINYDRHGASGRHV